MSHVPCLPDDVVSPTVYSRILTSSLQPVLIPEGLIHSPYEILDYQATLTLHDEQGARATFHRRQQIRFLQEGVSGVLDLAWGAGVLLTNYRHSAGQLAEPFKNHGRRYLVVKLARPCVVEST